jgi:hypothetical protein
MVVDFVNVVPRGIRAFRCVVVLEGRVGPLHHIDMIQRHPPSRRILLRRQRLDLLSRERLALRRHHLGARQDREKPEELHAGTG